MMKEIINQSIKVFKVNALVASVAFTSAHATTISVDFTGNSQSTTLSSTDVAGVIPADTWSTATGLTGTISAPPAIPGPAATVAWNAPTFVNLLTAPPADPDEAMMEGGLGGLLTSVSPVASIPATVDISGLNLSALGWASYDVYVYMNHGNGTGGASMAQILGIGSVSLVDHSPVYGAVPGSTYIDGGSSPTGNYVRFTGLTASSFTLNSTPGVPLPNNDLSAINGIQIVGVPEPSTALLGCLGAGLIMLRRR